MNEKEKEWIRRFYFGPGTLLVDKTGTKTSEVNENSII